MKKRIYRMMMTVLLAAAALISISLNADQVYAAEDWTQAVNVNVNKDISGSLTQGSNKEQNIYRIKLDKAGVVSIVFNNPRQADSKDYWRVRIVNEEYEEILDEDVQGNRTRTELTKTGLDAGYYYVEVMSSQVYSLMSGDQYTINIGFTASEYWEKELNESFPAATSIKVNADYHGTTDASSNHEKDYYKFELSKPGSVSIHVSYPLQATTEAYWKLYLYDEEYNEINIWNLYGSQPDKDLTSIGLPKGTFYICICCSQVYTFMSNEEYVFSVNYTQSDFWEKELNENFASASPMICGETYYGTTHAYGNYESDYYSVLLNANSTYTVRIETPIQGSSDDYWTLEFFDPEYNSLKSMNISGTAEKRSFNITLEPGCYYVRIRCKSTYSGGKFSDDVYALTVSEVHYHNMIHYSGVSPTCTTAGSIEYWYCDKCGKYYSDEAGEKEISEDDIPLSELGHKIVLMPQVEPTCVKEGMEPYYRCTRCGAKFADAEGETPITAPEKIAMIDHSLYNVPASEPTYEKDGNIEYWKCSSCGKVFSDADGKNEITHASTVIAKLQKPTSQQPQVAEIQNLPAVRISKPKAAKGALTVKWKKASKKVQKKISGYQIQVASDSSFTNIVKTVKAGKKASSKKIKLVRKTRYYVRIRAIKGSAFGAWSSTKSVKTK